MTASRASSAPSARAAVAVVTFDSAPHIERCLATLEEALRGSPDVAVVVVDNASSDRTVDLARAAPGRAELIVNERNLGFAAANNRAIRLAEERGFEFVYLLNPDTAVEPGFLDEALALAATDASIAAVQSLLLLEPDDHLIDSAGNRLHFLGFGYCALHRRPRAEAPREPIEIAFPSGAGALLRLSALRRSGAMREDLQLFCEDLDLGWRLRLAGFRSLLAPRSIVRHRHEFLRNPDKFFLLERNRILVVLSNYSLRSLALLAPLLALNELALAAISLAQGWLRAKARAWAALLLPRSWREIRAARARVAAIRTVADRDVARWFTPRMEIGTLDGRFVTRIANPVLERIWRVVLRLL